MIAPYHNTQPPEEKNRALENVLNNIYEKPVESIVSISLAKFPQSYDIVLPINELFPVKESYLLSHVYPRLSEPVPHFDASTSDLVTGQRTHLEVLDNHKAATKKVEPVNLHELYPITRALQIKDKIDEKVWDAAEYDCMEVWGNCFRNYEHMKTIGRYDQFIVEYEDWDSLKLFGAQNNSLKAVAQFASLPWVLAQGYRIVLHFVGMVCWQFYLLERERWLQVKLVQYESFVEADLPHFFHYFPRFDSKKDPYNPFFITGESPSHPRVSPGPKHKEWIEAITTEGGLGKFVRKYDFVTFWYVVMNHVLLKLNRDYFYNDVITNKELQEFVSGKLFNNFFQYLHTSHFWPLFVDEFDMYCINSVSARSDNDSSFKNTHWMEPNLTKNYVSMKTIAWQQYNLTVNTKPQLNNTEDKPHEIVKNTKPVSLLKVRIPYPHAHYHFNPEEPIFKFGSVISLIAEAKDPQTIKNQSKMQDKVFFQLAKCMDRKLLGEIRTFLNTCRRQWKGKQAHPPVKSNNRKRKLNKATPASILTRAAPVLMDESTDEKVAVAAEVHEEEGEGEESDQEDVNYEPVQTNLVRARYSFCITKDEKKLCSGVIPFLRWKDHFEIQPETSVNFISPRVWKWLVDSGEAHEASLKSTYSLMKINADEFLDDGISQIVVHSWIKDNHKFVVLVNKNKVKLRKYTMDFFCVQKYFEMKLEKIQSDNWYYPYYGLIILLRSETQAAAQIYQDFKERLSPNATEEQVLRCLQQDYDRVRLYLRYTAYKELRKYPTIANLIELLRKEWDRQCLVLTAPDKWKLAFTGPMIKEYIEKHLPKMEDLIVKNAEPGLETNSARSIITTLINHLSSDDPQVKLPYQMSKVQIAVRLENGYYSSFMNIQELHNYLIGLFEPLFIKLSFFSQHMFPGAVIRISDNKLHNNLKKCWEICPEAIRCVYSLSKHLRSAEFVQEVANMVKAKVECESRGIEPDIPVIAKLFYSECIYHLQNMEQIMGESTHNNINPENCSEKDRALDRLQNNLKYLTQSRIYTTDQKQVIERQVRFIGNMLRYASSHKIMPRLFEGLYTDLAPLFDPGQLTDEIYNVLNQVMKEAESPTVTTIILQFKKACEEAAKNKDHPLLKENPLFKIITKKVLLESSRLAQDRSLFPPEQSRQ